ncbi:unnamed protein product [Lampetra planeri]
MGSEQLLSIIIISLNLRLKLLSQLLGHFVSGRVHGVPNRAGIVRSSSNPLRLLALFCDVEMSNTELLHLGTQEDELLYRRLMLQAVEEAQAAHPVPVPPSNQITPSPGLCVKTQGGPEGEQPGKVFVNVCTSPAVPSPPSISEEQLAALLDSSDPTSYRVPMSLGEPHDEFDTGGNVCTAYDVVINPEFYDRAKGSELFMNFLLIVVLEGLEDKYHIQINKEWKLLKNRKFMGSLSQQHVRTRPRPVIQELSSGSSQLPSNQPKDRESIVQPKYRLLREPASGQPRFLVAEINLPKMTSSSSLQLDLGEDRVVLSTQPSRLPCLEFDLPWCVQQEESSAQFNRDTKILHITMPVQE